MTRVLIGLNPAEGPDFVVYIDDILIFSRTMEEHVQHLLLVLQRLQEAGTQAQTRKCRFIRLSIWDSLSHPMASKLAQE